ncbi:MAG: DUF362 domain-containing protein [Promethearchaeota archaeon]
MSFVSFVQTKDSDLMNAIELSLNLIDYEFPKKIREIVVKPNMCYYWDYSTGQTTDPRFIMALIEILRRKISSDTEISVVESDASAMKCRYAFKMLGYEKLANDYNVRLINLSEDKSDIFKVTAGGRIFRLKVPQTILNADLKINVPKIKYAMESIKLTCALKNIFGCNPYRKKYQYHSRLNEAIVAINKAMKFDLHIIDGYIVSGIQPRKLGLVMASKDPVAIDAAASKIAGINRKTIKYLQLAKKEGLGSITFISKGEPLEYFKSQYPKKNLRTKFMSKAYIIAVQTGLGKRIGLK